MNPLVLTVIDDFAQAAQDAATKTYRLLEHLRTVDQGFLSVLPADRPLSPTAIGVEFIGRSQPFLSLAPNDVPSPARPLLHEFQDALKKEILPLFSVAATDWEELFPAGKAPSSIGREDLGSPLQKIDFRTAIFAVTHAHKSLTVDILKKYPDFRGTMDCSVDPG